ncbi:MAG: LysR family transcriptional regulator [Mycobacteriaceae bacterium]|uniref:LysR family transcriptional regulator n=1 Tax=Corynebacterium sp. TaxID=1720 RepID=UPI003F9C81F4
MHPNIPPVDQLVTLAAVDKRRSIAAAARDLDLSQQTVSARVAAAERTLGTPVFERTTSGCLATGPGRRILDAAATYLAAAEGFSREVTRTTVPEGQTGSRILQVAVSNTIAELYFPVWAARFHRERPDVRLSMRPRNSAEVCDEVADGDCVLGFVEGAAVRHGLASTVVGVDDLVVVVPASHPWVGREVSANTLRTTPLITRERGSGSREIVENTLGRIATPAGEFGSLSAQRAAVTGMGEPTVIAERAVAEQVASGALVRVPVRGVTFRRSLRAVYPRQVTLDEDAAALLDLARRTGGTAV